MAITDYPILSRSEVETPPSGFQKLFRDSGNGNRLTAKTDHCSFDVISVMEVSKEAMSYLSEVVNQIIDDAGCALKKGMINADQYESIVDNLNSCLEVNIDPNTGSQQICYTNTPTLFISLTLTNVICNGGSTGTAAVATTGGTAPYTVDWGVGVDEAALAAGSYMVTVTDANSKTKAQTFIISEPAALAAVESSTPETVAGNDGTATATVSGGVSPYTYLWDDGGAQTTPTATALVAGDYNCVVTDANGCILNVGPITVA